MRRQTPAANPQPGRTITAPQPVSLVSVGDGDTLRVATADGSKLTIRLACIDAPETAQGYLGADARINLARLLQGSSLQILPQTADRYGRTVAEVIANGRSVNLEMVRSGQAYAFRKYLSGCDQNAYLQAEAEAERRRLGVWRYQQGVQRPWDFRDSRRK